MNRNPYSVILILSLVTLSLFGIFAIGNMSHVDGEACPLSVLSGNECPPVGGLLQEAVHHLSGFQALTQSKLYTQFSLSLIFFALSVLLFSFFKQADSATALRINKFNALKIESVTLTRFMRWISNINTRDDYAPIWVYAT